MKDIRRVLYLLSFVFLASANLNATYPTIDIKIDYVADWVGFEATYLKTENVSYDVLETFYSKYIAVVVIVTNTSQTQKKH